MTGNRIWKSLTMAAFSAALFLGNSAVLRAQAPAEPSAPVLKSESKVVRVDVVVTDKKGHYIRDLTAKDFHVFDNNKEQPIVNFSFGAEGPHGGPDRHYMVLFFDDSTMDISDQPRARKAAMQFIDANAGPDRLMAVVDFTGTLQIFQNFTADADKLKKAAALYKPSAVTSNAGNDASISALGAPSLYDTESDYGARTFLLAIRSLARNLAPVPGRKSLILFTDGFPVTTEQQSEITATISACNQANVAIYPLDVRGLIASNVHPDRIHAGNASPSDGENDSGRPKLVLAAYPVAGEPAEPPQKGGGGGGGHGGGGGGGTGGGGGGTGGHGGSPGGGAPGGGGSRGGPGGGGGAAPTSPYAPFQTTLYGMTTPQMILPTIQDGGAINQDLLHELADGTGGFPIYNTNDLLNGLAKIADEQNEYYLLAYSPVDIGAPLACHAVKVKVDRGGTTVRSRTGYCNTKPSDLLVGKPIEKELEAKAAAPATPGIGGTLEAPFVYTAPNIARVNVAIDVPSSSINFSKEKGRYGADINILGIASKPDGSVAARFSDEVKLDLEKEEWKKFLEKPMFYGNQFQIPAGQYKLSVVLSAGDQNFGKYEMPLSIEPYDGKTFTLSPITLSDNIQPAAGMGGALEADLLSDRAPLVVKDMEVVPSGSNHFKRTETVALYTQIYDPALTDAKPPTIKFTFVIVDAKSGQSILGSRDLDVTSFTSKGNPVVPVGLKLPVDQLQPGSYRLVVQATNDAGQKTNIRSVNFDAE